MYLHLSCKSSPHAVNGKTCDSIKTDFHFSFIPLLKPFSVKTIFLNIAILDKLLCFLFSGGHEF